MRDYMILCWYPQYEPYEQNLVMNYLKSQRSLTKDKNNINGRYWYETVYIDRFEQLHRLFCTKKQHVFDMFKDNFLNRSTMFLNWRPEKIKK